MGLNMTAMLPLPRQAEFATDPYYNLVLSDWQYTHGVRLPSLNQSMVHAGCCTVYQHLPTKLILRIFSWMIPCGNADDSCG
jgi:hypothetical protein